MLVKVPTFPAPAFAPLQVKVENEAGETAPVQAAAEDELEAVADVVVVVVVVVTVFTATALVVAAAALVGVATALAVPELEDKLVAAGLATIVDPIRVAKFCNTVPPPLTFTEPCLRLH